MGIIRLKLRKRYVGSSARRLDRIEKAVKNQRDLANWRQRQKEQDARVKGNT